MPTRTLTADGRTWKVYPSGFNTQYVLDEFGLIFVAGDGDDREVRVTRYSPRGDRGRERSLGELSDAELLVLLNHSQASDTSPEIGYRLSPRIAALELPPRLASGAPGQRATVAARLPTADRR